MTHSAAEDQRADPALIRTCPNPDGSTTYYYEYPSALDVGFGTIGGFVITGHPEGK